MSKSFKQQIDEKISSNYKERYADYKGKVEEEFRGKDWGSVVRYPVMKILQSTNSSLYPEEMEQAITEVLESLGWSDTIVNYYKGRSISDWIEITIPRQDDEEG